MVSARASSKRFIIAASVFVVLVGAAVAGRSQLVPLLWMFRVGDSTYYGWHTNILHAGESVVLLEEFTPPGHIALAKGTRGSVKSDPAWDEDSCDPDRPVSITISADDTVAVPRHILRR